jgi:hypothetical protein
MQPHLDSGLSHRETAVAVFATAAGLAAVVIDQMSDDGDSMLIAGVAGAVTVGFAVLLFAGLVPRAKARAGHDERTARSAVVTGGIACLSVASAWSGLPFVLGAGGAMLGLTARSGTSSFQRALGGFGVALGLAAVALGCVALVAF